MFPHICQQSLQAKTILSLSQGFDWDAIEKQKNITKLINKRSQHCVSANSKNVFYGLIEHGLEKAWKFILLLIELFGAKAD